MSKKRFITGCFLLCLSLFGSLQARESAVDTVDVEVGVFLIDIEEINSVSQSFVANLYLEVRWHDPGLAHDGPDSISRSLDEFWHPRMQILNQQKLERTFPGSAEIKPDGEVIFRQRVWGGFSQPLELHQFPFDTQRLEINFIEVGFGTRELRLKVAPQSAVSDHLSIPDWEVLAWDFKVADILLSSDTPSEKGLVLSVDVKRYLGYFVLKIIFPLMLIVFMSWLVFWIDPSLAASQISISVTAMLTMIAYRFAIGGMMPRLPFLTPMDYFVMASTVLVFLSLIEVVYTAYLTKWDRLETARRVDFHARWIAPLIYLLVLAETLFFRISL